MSAPMFSIIVPVYKTEKYLAKCIESILAQDCGDFELIPVDDGSPDGCGAVIDRYALKDCRIKAVHKQNEGAAEARKTGFAAARGEYIINVDSDDYMLPGALGRIKDSISKSNADVCVFGFMTEKNGERVSVIPNFTEGVYKGGAKSTLYERVVYDRKQRFFTFGVYPALWQRAVKSELLKKACVKADSKLKIGEDFVISLPAMLAADTISIIGEPLYFYRVIDNSASRKFDENGMKYFADMLKNFESTGTDTEQYGIRNQLGAYTVYSLYNFLSEYAERTDEYEKYIDCINGLDKIIFRYTAYCKYNFKDLRQVLFAAVIKNGLWRVLWFYAKRKGTK